MGAAPAADTTDLPQEVAALWTAISTSALASSGSSRFSFRRPFTKPSWPLVHHDAAFGVPRHERVSLRVQSPAAAATRRRSSAERISAGEARRQADGPAGERDDVNGRT